MRKQKLPTPKSRATAQRILLAAAHCIAVLGIEKTSITEIAKRAKTSRGLVAHYFPRKSELFFEVIQGLMDEATPNVYLPDGAASFEERIYFHIRKNFEFFHEYPAYYTCFTLLLYYAGIRKDCRELLTELHEYTLARSKEHLVGFAKEKGLIPPAEGVIEQFARGLIAEAEGAMQICYFMNHGLSFEEFVTQHLESLRSRLQAFLGQCARDPN